MPCVNSDLIPLYQRVFQIEGKSTAFDALFLTHGSDDQSASFEIYESMKKRGVNVLIKPHPRFSKAFCDKEISLLDSGKRHGKFCVYQ